tara:strand:- start:2569 stop:3126 length:558 start_codon:yes stop_codon:yes gene_type:complete
MAQNLNSNQLPYKSIPEYQESYNSGNIVIRMIQGLGYRYYWATEGLTPDDMSYVPSESGQSLLETLEHIYGLANIVKNTSKNFPSSRPAKYIPSNWSELRSQTLTFLEEAATNLKNKTPDELSKLHVIFERGGNLSTFPFWNMINGPLSDAIYHTGQIVSFRRSSGNPIPKGTNVFMGKTKQYNK